MVKSLTFDKCENIVKFGDALISKNDFVFKISMRIDNNGLFSCRNKINFYLEDTAKRNNDLFIYCFIAKLIQKW
jgi:hypothetical protein